MNVEIVTPTSLLYSGEVKLIKLPGLSGSLEFMNNHAPIITTLKKGQIKLVDNNGKISHYEISGGVAECSQNKVSVVVEAGKELIKA